MPRPGHGPNQVFRPIARTFPIHLADFRGLGVERKPRRELSKYGYRKRPLSQSEFEEVTKSMRTRGTHSPDLPVPFHFGTGSGGRLPCNPFTQLLKQPIGKPLGDGISVHGNETASREALANAFSSATVHFSMGPIHFPRVFLPTFPNSILPTYRPHRSSIELSLSYTTFLRARTSHTFSIVTFFRDRSMSMSIKAGPIPHGRLSLSKSQTF